MLLTSHKDSKIIGDVKISSEIVSLSSLIEIVSQKKTPFWIQSKGRFVVFMQGFLLSQQHIFIFTFLSKNAAKSAMANVLVASCLGSFIELPYCPLQCLVVKQ